MPELPEVETLKRQLESKILGEELLKIEVFCEKLRFPIDKNALLGLEGFFIKKISRRGKYLIFNLEKEKVKKNLLIHLGMSGSLKFLNANKKLHDHLIIYFKNQKLFFNDPRKFGAVLVFEEENPPKSLKILGIEPLEENFNGLFLKNALKNKGSKIKSLIMEQSLVVGVGNIYAAEALFLAKISPFRAGNSLTDKDCENLASAIKLVLKKGIENQGTTLKDYKQSDGSSGHNQNSLLVYGRDNQPCFNCQTLIKNEIITGRMSYFCPNCQK